MIYLVGFNEESYPDYRHCSFESAIDYFKDHDYLGLDTETAGRDPHTKPIVMLQLGDGEKQFVIDARNVNIARGGHLQKLVDDILILGHNLKFDYKFLKHKGITLNRVYDTMLGEVIIWNGYERHGYGYADLARRYLGLEVEKDTRGEFHKHKDKPFTYKQIEYGAGDVRHLGEFMERQFAKIVEYDLEYAVAIENEAMKALADIEYNGIILDKTQWLSIAQRTETELLEAQIALDEFIIEHFPGILSFTPADLFRRDRLLNINYSSPTQLLKFFHKIDIHLPDTSALSITDGILVERGKSQGHFLVFLQEIRKLEKKCTTYGRAFLDYINTATGRVHTDFWQIKHTYRLGSGSKDMNAPNMQNIPRSNVYRHCFKAREGYSWLSIDYSQQELRLMADASGEEGFIDVLNSGGDLHCYVGTELTGQPITKADKEKRDRAKTLNFGKPYGMGPHKFAATLNISIPEAEETFKKYAEKFPKLEAWLQRQAAFAFRHGYIELPKPHKGIRWFPEVISMLNSLTTYSWKEKNIIKNTVSRLGMNTPIQGGGAAIMKEALIEIRELIARYNQKHGQCAYLINTVHDQLDVEVRSDLVEQFAEEACYLMQIAGNRYVTKVSMTVDATIDTKWTKG